MINMSSILYKFSGMDRSSQMLLFLIVLVTLMLISITIINFITKKKNNKYDIENRNIKRYSDLIKEEDKKIEKQSKNENNKELIKVEEEIESLELDEPKEEIIISKPSTIEEISKLIENTLEQEPIDLTTFEEEQEKDAIISYDELVKRAGAKKIIYKAETIKEEKKDPVMVVKQENQYITDNKKNIKQEYSNTFKASQIVSPIYGVQKEKIGNFEEKFIDLENFKLDETKDEIEMENEFLGNLKTFRNNLD